MSTIGALEGVPQQQAGLACGLSNTAQQVGGSLGVAILTIAVQHTHQPARRWAPPSGRAHRGFGSGYSAALVFPGIGLLVALLRNGARPGRAAAPSQARGRRRTQPPVAREALDPRRFGPAFDRM